MNGRATWTGARVPHTARRCTTQAGRLGAALLLAAQAMAQPAPTAPTAPTPAGPAASAAPASPRPATPSSTRHQFNIPPSDLGRAVLAVGATAGLRVLFDPQRLAGLQSQGLSGPWTVQEALERLLRGSGFKPVFTGPDSVRLESLSAAPTVAELAAGLTPADGPLQVLPTVSVRGGEKLAPEDAPYRRAGSSHVIGRDDIERFRGTSVGDIFQGTPGVLVGENRNSGGLDVNIRGMQGQGRVPVLVDGARQENTVYRGYGGVSSRSYVDPDLIGGIVVDKGPTLSAGGTGALGGLVSMRTLNADDIITPGKTFGVRLRGSLIGNNSGSPSAPNTPAGLNVGGLLTNEVFRKDCVTPSLCEGPYDLANVVGPPDTMDRPGALHFKGWAGSVAVAQRFELADLVVAYAQRHQGNYYAGKNGPGTPWVDLSDTTPRGFWTEVRPRLMGDSRFRAQERVVNSNFENQSLLLKTRLFLPQDQELEFSYLRYHSVFGELMPSQLLWLGRARQTDNSRVTTHTVTGQYHWNPEQSRWLDLRVNVWGTDTDSLNRGYSDDMKALINDNLNSSERYRRRGLDATNTLRWPQWGGLKLDLGAALQWEEVRSAGLEPTAFYFRNGDRRELSLFAALQWKPLPRLTLDAGLRHTRFRSEDLNALAVAGDSSFCLDNDRDGTCDPIYPHARSSGSAPLVSLTWEPLDGLQLYARQAEALRMPSLFETTSGFSVSPTLDTLLRPEHARNREVGLNLLRDGLLRRGDKLRFKLAYFRNHTRDYLTRTVPNTWEDTSTGINATLFRMRNIESADFHGVELSGGYDLGFAFTELGATRYTRIETCHYGSFRRYTCTNYGVAASYVNNMIPPRWHGSALLGARLLDRKLTVGARGTFMGQRNPVPAFDDQTAGGFLRPVLWRPYRLLDLFASYQFSERFSVDMNLDNVTDRYYLDALSLGLVPAPGRTARISVTAQF